MIRFTDIFNPIIYNYLCEYIDFPENLKKPSNYSIGVGVKTLIETGVFSNLTELSTEMYKEAGILIYPYTLRRYIKFSEIIEEVTDNES